MLWYAVEKDGKYWAMNDYDGERFEKTLYPESLMNKTDANRIAKYYKAKVVPFRITQLEK
jgi:hypothetical protein